MSISYATTPRPVDVRAAVDLFATPLLGRHVQRCTQHLTGSRAAVVTASHELGDAEVEQLGLHLALVVVGEEDVLRLQIAMRDAGFVSRIQGACGTTQDRQRLFELERAVLVDVIFQRLALEQLHREVLPAVGQLSEVEDVDDATVLDLIDRLRLREETLDHAAALHVLAVEHLDRRLLPDDGVYGAVDVAECAGADRVDHFIPADLGAGQQRQLARRRRELLPLAGECSGAQQ